MKQEPDLRSSGMFGEQIFRILLISCSLASVFITIGIAAFLLKESLPFFFGSGVDLFSFLTGDQWQPAIGNFGILPLLTATILNVGIAMLFAVPIGLGVAVYLNEFASNPFKGILKPVLELFSGIPSIVFGYFALSVLTPFLRSLLGREVIDVYNVFSAGLVTGLLVLPVFITLAEDALQAVPDYLREGPYGIGATRFETYRKVILPAAYPGLISAFVTVLSRAIGESMIVHLAAGSGPNLTPNPFRAAETMTGYIMRIAGGEMSPDTVDYQSIFALGLVLFLITFPLNIAARIASEKSRGGVRE